MVCGSRFLINIANTFREHEILLTGANGFLGKVIFGLLVDRYPDFKHLHVLIRPREDSSPQERFEREMLVAEPLAELVKRFGVSRLVDKTTVWGGDAADPHCGFEESDLVSLQGRIGLVLNCAGLVDFFAPLDQALRANVYSVQRVAALAQRLDAKLLHVSTCYVAGCADGLVEETEPILGFYPRRQGSDDGRFDHVQELSECRRGVEEILQSKHSDDELESRVRTKDQLIASGRHRADKWGWVNTYTYTKSMGEQVLADIPDLDFTIVRPAIVESALRFPFAGWVEGGRTAAPLVLMALGGLKDWPVRRDIPLEVVPVDQVAAATLVAGALLLNGEHESVYQLATADINPLWLGELVELLVDEAEHLTKNGGSAARWLDPLPRLRFLDKEQAHFRKRQFERKLRRIDGLVASIQRRLGRYGRSPRSTLTAWRTSLRTLELQLGFREQVLQQYLPFIYDHRYIFEARRISEGYKKISTADRELLCWSPEKINWDSYWRNNQIKGIRKWVEPEAVREWNFRI
ncbi:MAG: hypothetical protein CMN58_08060 [Solibacterales bacterium]|nr:hypothetical protein [Bryobacterales bacterium]|tara:strand:- start:20388 stop:21950 length:1563 start_codon:yes stop_codon:yes gene_type:complete